MRGRKLQLFAYTIGIVFIALSFVQFAYANILQDEMSHYQKKIDKMEKIRADLWKLRNGYLEAYADLLNADWTTYYKITYGWITELEGNLTIIGAIPEIMKMDYFFFNNFLINYRDNDYRILFVSSIINLTYAAPDTSYLYNALSDYSSYIITEDIPYWAYLLYTPDSNLFYWNNTIRILIDWMPTATALHIWVDFIKFDEFVEGVYLHPLIEAEGALSQLFVISSSITFGILLLGFIIDFGNISEAMKKIYIILALISVGIAVFSSSVTIIRIIGGGL